jgi:hypothetical protein
MNRLLQSHRVSFSVVSEVLLPELAYLVEDYRIACEGHCVSLCIPGAKDIPLLDNNSIYYDEKRCLIFIRNRKDGIMEGYTLLGDFVLDFPVGMTIWGVIQFVSQEFVITEDDEGWWMKTPDGKTQRLEITNCSDCLAPKHPTEFGYDQVGSWGINDHSICFHSWSSFHTPGWKVTRQDGLDQVCSLFRIPQCDDYVFMRVGCTVWRVQLFTDANGMTCSVNPHQIGFFSGRYWYSFTIDGGYVTHLDGDFLTHGFWTGEASEETIITERVKNVCLDPIRGYLIVRFLNSIRVYY